jgi:hypothetical protein
MPAQASQGLDHLQVAVVAFVTRIQKRDEANASLAGAQLVQARVRCNLGHRPSVVRAAAGVLLFVVSCATLQCRAVGGWAAGGCCACAASTSDRFLRSSDVSGSTLKVPHATTVRQRKLRLGTHLVTRAA